MRLFSRSRFAEFVSGAVRHARRSWKSPSRRTQYRGSAMVQLLEQRTLLTPTSVPLLSPTVMPFQWTAVEDMTGDGFTPDDRGVSGASVLISNHRLHTRVTTVVGNYNFYQDELTSVDLPPLQLPLGLGSANYAVAESPVEVVSDFVVLDPRYPLDLSARGIYTKIYESFVFDFQLPQEGGWRFAFGDAGDSTLGAIYTTRFNESGQFSYEVKIADAHDFGSGYFRGVEGQINQITNENGVVVHLEPFYDVRVGLFRNPRVSGVLYNDHNGNGVKDIGDEPLANHSIFAGSNTPNAENVYRGYETTNDNGEYTLYVPPNLILENDQRVLLRDRFVGGGASTVESQTSGLEPILTSNLSSQQFTRDIGIFKKTTVSGQVYVDHNGNGRKDAEDEPRAGVRVFVDQYRDGLLTELDHPVEYENPVTTDENGRYEIVSSGGIVRVISPGNPASLFSITQGGSTGYSALSGVPLAGADFGVFQTATIEGFVFNDVNGNGKYEHPTDTPAGRVKLQLDIGNDGTIDDSYIVGDSGEYQFRAPAGAYRVFLAAPVTGQKQTAPASAAGHVGVVTQDRQRIEGLLFGVQRGKDVGIAIATFDGTTFKVDFSATTAITTPFNIGFYQSDDAKFSASDRRFGQLLSVTPPESGQGTAEFTIPAAYVHDKTKPFLLVVADPDGKIAELTETNNTLTATRIIDVSPLKIVGGNFQYDRLTDSFKATGGEFAIGFKPATAESFFPLVRVEGDMTYDAKIIQSTGVVTATVGDFTSTLFAGKWDLRFADATTTLLKPFVTTQVSNFALAGFGLKFHSLKLVNPGGPLTTDSYLEITGTLKPPLTSIDIEFTADHVLKLTSTGPVVDRRIALPKFKFKVYGMEVEAEGLSLEYFHPRRAFRLQGKVSLDNVLKVLGGDLVQKISADFSEQNYLEWNQNGFVAVGSIAVEKIEIWPDELELRDVKISFNTLKEEWRGEAEIKLPFLPGNTTLLAGIGFKNAELNFISLGADHLNIPLPLPSAKPVFLQKVQAQIDNIVDIDPNSFEFGATIGLTDALELIRPPGVPEGPFDFLLGPFFRADLTGKISGNHLVGAVEGFVLSKEFLTVAGQVELDWTEARSRLSAYHSDWERFAINVKGSVNAFKGIVTGQVEAKYSTDLSTPVGTRTFVAAGNVTIKFTEDLKEELKEDLPEWVTNRLIDRELIGKVNINVTGDGNDANDYVIGYFDSDLPLIGRKTLGFRLGVFDGSFQLLSNMLAVTSAAVAPPSAAAEAPSLMALSSATASGSANEFTVPPATGHLIMAASWQNDVGPVSLEVVAPDGTVIRESSCDPGQIVVLEEFSTSKTRVIGLAAPATGLWRVQLANTEGVGEVVYEASINSVAPTIEVTNVTLDGAIAIIDYSAADSDSDATVHFFYDTDNSGLDGVPILDPVAEGDNSGSVTWDTSLLPQGTYFVYTMIDDGNNAPAYAYAETPIVIEGLPRSISGVVFEDSDASGVREDGEQPLANWIVFLDANNNGVLDNLVSGNNVADANATEVWTPSNTNGEYSFDDVALGVHLLDVVNQAGFTPTFTADGEPLLVVLTEDNPQRLIDFGSDRLPPVISSLSQTAVIAGSVSAPNLLTLTIRGTGFIADAPNPVQTVEVNTPDDPDLFVGQTTIIDSPTQMRVLIPADQLATARTAKLRINHTDVGRSNVLDLIVSSNVVSISSTSASQPEGNSATTPCTFTITRSGNMSESATVDYVVSGSGVNAATTDDFNGIFPSGSVTFVAGQTSQVITIDVSGDTVVELAETFDVRLTSAVGTAIANSNATGTITNDDTSFTIAAVSASKLEGNTGSTPFTFTVTRNGVTTGTGSVKYAVTGSGTSPAVAADFAATIGSVSFAIGETSKLVTINVKGETAFELDEAFAVTLNTPVGGILGTTAAATGTILNDDTAVTIAATDAIKAEGTGNTPTSFTFTVTRLGNLNVASTVKYAVAANGSGAATAAATDFIDHKFPKGNVTFAAGEATKLITVPVVAESALEGNEGFKVTLAARTGATLGAATVATGTIQNDDASLSIAATSAVKAEGTGATPTAFTFTVTRTGDVTGVVSATYSVGGAAKDGANATDFGGSFPAGTVEFAANETTKPVTINVTSDTIGETNEGFLVTLSNPTNAILGTTVSNGTITNDDTSFSVIPVNATSASKAEGSTTANPPGNTAFTFTVTRIGLPVAGSVEFAVIGSGDNPADIGDFMNDTLPTGTLTFAANKATQTLTINVRADRLVELQEGFTVMLANPVGATLANATANGTILNDDTTFAIAATDATKAEGNAGLTAFTFTVTRDGVTTGKASVKFVVTSGGLDPAIAADFGTHVPANSVSFTAGETSKLITINVKGDVTTETDEGFLVTLSSPSTGATIITASALGTILNDD